MPTIKLGASVQPFARPGDDEATSAARGLEAHFLKQMLAEVRNTSEGSMLDGGFAGSTFKEMLDGALSDKMAQAGRLGIAPMLTKEMSKHGKDGGAKAAPPGVHGLHASINSGGGAAGAARPATAAAPGAGP